MLKYIYTITPVMKSLILVSSIIGLNAFASSSTSPQIFSSCKICTSNTTSVGSGCLTGTLGQGNSYSWHPDETQNDINAYLFKMNYTSIENGSLTAEIQVYRADGFNPASRIVDQFFPNLQVGRAYEFGESKLDVNYNYSCTAWIQ